MKSVGLQSTFIAALLLSGGSSAADDFPLELSGFARLVAGYLDTDQAYYAGYENKLSVSEQSLVGLQADYRFTDTVSLSGQLLFHSDNNRNSGVEWLYLRYEPTSDWQFKAGRLRTPYLKYSDVFDVGFSYPWISPPRQLYGSYLFFPRYEGVNARYQFSVQNVYIDFEAYYGAFADDINVNGESFHVDVSQMYGGIVEANYQGWQVRAASFIANDVEATADGLDALVGGLRLAGFGSIADFFNLNGHVDTYLLGLSYDNLDWFLSAEYADVRSGINILAGVENYYFTLGHYFDEYQLLISYAKSNQELAALDNTIPLGVAPQLDLLHVGVDQLLARFPTDELDSVTLTGRWDVRSNLAIKAEVSFLYGEADKTSLFELKENSDGFDRKAVLYQVGLEWVF